MRLRGGQNVMSRIRRSHYVCVCVCVSAHEESERAVVVVATVSARARVAIGVDVGALWKQSHLRRRTRRSCCRLWWTETTKSICIYMIYNSKLINITRCQRRLKSATAKDKLWIQPEAKKQVLPASTSRAKPTLK